MLVSQEFADAHLTFDDRYFPIVVMRWDGLADIEAAKWGMDHLAGASKTAVARGTRLVSISDARRARRPSAEVRKYFAAESARGLPEQADVVINTYVVLDSALLRGALTAIGWLSPSVQSVKTTATIEEAIEQALQDLEANGVARPHGLSAATYTMPAVRRSKTG